MLIQLHHVACVSKPNQAHLTASCSHDVPRCRSATPLTSTCSVSSTSARLLLRGLGGGLSPLLLPPFSGHHFSVNSAGTASATAPEKVSRPIRAAVLVTAADKAGAGHAGHVCQREVRGKHAATTWQLTGFPGCNCCNILEMPPPASSTFNTCKPPAACHSKENDTRSDKQVSPVRCSLLVLEQLADTAAASSPCCWCCCTASVGVQTNGWRC